MATPRCPKCENTSFEMQELKVTRANYRHLCINCSGCGAIVAVHEFFNVSDLIHKLAKRLGVTLD